MPQAFPVLSECVHFDHAAVAPIPLACADAMMAATLLAARGKHCDGAWYSAAIRVRSLAAKMVGARGPHEIAFIPNTSTGLATLALAGFRGRPWQEGDHVICLANDFPANRLPWLALRKHGVKVTEIAPGSDGLIGTSAILSAITRHTRIVSVPHVVYSTGEKLDLKAISRETHLAGGWLCVDAIQSVGAMPVDVVADGVDFLAADGHKWMLGPEGAGFLYCHEDLIPQLPPPIIGWTNRKNPLNFEAPFEPAPKGKHADIEDPWQPDARRFEPGTWNVISLHGLAASLEVLLAEGLPEVWRSIDALNARLRAGLEEKGCKIISPRAEARRSGIVAFDPPAGKTAEEVHALLLSRGIRIALRAGRLRASPHFYNTEAQVEQLLSEI